MVRHWSSEPAQARSIRVRGIMLVVLYKPGIKDASGNMYSRQALESLVESFNKSSKDKKSTNDEIVRLFMEDDSLMAEIKKTVI